MLGKTASQRRSTRQRRQQQTSRMTTSKSSLVREPRERGTFSCVGIG